CACAGPGRAHAQPPPASLKAGPSTRATCDNPRHDRPSSELPAPAMFVNFSRDIARLRDIKSKPWPFYFLESLLFENGFQAVMFPRLAHWFKARRIPFLGPAFARLGLLLTGVDISPGAVIGPGLRISHGTGLVIGGQARIGADAVLHHGVTIGARRPS